MAIFQFAMLNYRKAYILYIYINISIYVQMYLYAHTSTFYTCICTCTCIYILYYIYIVDATHTIYIYTIMYAYRTFLYSIPNFVPEKKTHPMTPHSAQRRSSDAGTGHETASQDLTRLHHPMVLMRTWGWKIVYLWDLTSTKSWISNHILEISWILDDI